MEIKFRGFSIENNCWIYGFYHEVEVEGVKYAYIFWQGESFPVDILSVGMFTGMRDINNVEIYNNDIYKSSYSDYIYVVSYEQGSFVAGRYKRDATPLGWGYYEDDSVITKTSDFSWLYIVGNVYQNSDLIK